MSSSWRSFRAFKASTETYDQVIKENKSDNYIWQSVKHKPCEEIIPWAILWMQMHKLWHPFTQSYLTSKDDNRIYLSLLSLFPISRGAITGALNPKNERRGYTNVFCSKQKQWFWHPNRKKEKLPQFLSFKHMLYNVLKPKNDWFLKMHAFCRKRKIVI